MVLTFISETIVDCLYVYSPERTSLSCQTLCDASPNTINKINYFKNQHFFLIRNQINGILLTVQN